MVDICTTLGAYIIEVIKIILILSVFLIATIIIVWSQYKQYIQDNWLEYRCNPLIMPFSGYFGHDSSENFSNCMMQIFTGFGGNMLQPVSFMHGQISGILKDFTDNIQGMRGFFYTFRNLFLTFVQGIMKRIEDGASTLQYLMTKLKAILERLWGIMVTIIYVGFTSVETMTSVFKGPIGGFAKFFCFDGDNLVNMVNNYNKKISDIEIGDEILMGGKVLGVLKFTSENNMMCNYKGVIVSATHLVKEDNKWKRIHQTNNAIILDKYNKEHIYCLITENNIINIKNCIFTDYIETSNPSVNSKIKSKMISYLNKKNYKNKYLNCKDYYCSGFDGNIIIKTLQGNKKLKDIEIGDCLANGKKVLGKIKQIPLRQDTFILNNLIVSGSNIVFYKNEWIQVKDIKGCQRVKYDNYLFNICTEDNIIKINNLFFRDYEEVEDENICLFCDKYIENYLNKNIKTKKKGKKYL
jgi:hypothetical protein